MKKMLFIIALCLSWACAYSQYWHNVSSGTSRDLLSISFGSATTGYIGGKDSLLLKTTDGGLTWQRLTLPSDIFSNARRDITDVSFVTANLGYITLSLYPESYFSRIYKTTDGGGSWTWLHAGNAVPLRCPFSAAGTGYAIGSTPYKGYAIYRIQGDTLSGQHVFSDNPYLFFRTSDFRNTTAGIVAGDEGLVARTFNGGADWDTVRTVMGATIHAVCFMNDSTILAGVDNPGSSVLISTDTGRTWDVEYNLLTFDYPVMKAMVRSVKDSFVIAGASTTSPGKGTIYWQNGDFAGFQNTDHALYDVDMRDDSIAYAVGANGHIVTNATAPLSIAGIDRLDVSLKIYPNPTYGNCTTELPVAHTIRVYDLNGKLIKEYDRPALQQKINLKGNAAGVYMLDITTVQGKLGTQLVLR